MNFRIWQIRDDTISHMLLGIAGAAWFLPFGLLAAAAAVAVIAIGKEVIWDWWLGRGTPEVRDTVNTMLGGAALLGWYALAARWISSLPVF